MLSKQNHEKRIQQTPFVHYFYRPKQDGVRAILSMSAKEPGNYQITTFFYSSTVNMFIAWSDSIHHTLKSCLKRLADEGYERERFKRFNLFEKPDEFVPSPLRDPNRREREKVRTLRAFGVDLSQYNKFTGSFSDETIKN
ncbi:hypothetical protein [Paenibacillus periandrae]|uniref:hypothetical protein n=1 Tax=Paenibacillus periandrae TaxID=1761741 RepID=UPI001F08F55F|nr:hypothetical protein [Paenibacillus periandrae]